MNQPNQPIITIERKFRPEIEGLRVVAALLVAIYHIWFHKVSGGVDVFFVISGFLITSSIISTINRTGEYRFWPYISKLIKRLFPSVFFILGITLIFCFFFLPASILDKTIREVIASMFYYQNWQLALSSTDYLDASQMKSPVEHFWALSIQGQFYLIWFIIFSFVLFIIKKFKFTNARKLINTILGIIFIVSLGYSIYLTSVNQPLAYFITFTRVWEFALGGLICVNLSYINLNNFITTIAGWIGLFGLISTGIIFEVSEMFPGYIALWPMLCAFFIILSGTSKSKLGVNKLLGTPFMVKLGGISFGIYLWHWVILSFYRYNVQQTPGFFVGTTIILISIILSFITTRYIEKPIRNSSSNSFSFKRLGVMGAANILIIGMLLVSIFIEQHNLEQQISDKSYPGALATATEVEGSEKEPIPPFSEVFDDLPEAHLDGSNQGLKNSDLKIGEYGETEDYDATIALIGSSHSEHWQGALLKAIEGSNYRLLNMTRSGTRLSTGYDDDDLKGIWNNNVLEYLKDADVDLVISHATAANTDKESIQQQMIDQLEFINKEYDIEVLAIRDNPRYSFNVLESLETEGFDKTTQKMNKEDNQKDSDFWEHFEQENKTLNKIDLSDQFKVNDKYLPVIGNVRIYRDEKHMTNTYSESFGPIFKEKIHEILEDN